MNTLILLTRKLEALNKIVMTLFNAFFYSLEFIINLNLWIIIINGHFTIAKWIKKNKK